MDGWWILDIYFRGVAALWCHTQSCVNSSRTCSSVETQSNTTARFAAQFVPVRLPHNNAIYGLAPFIQRPRTDSQLRTLFRLRSIAQAYHVFRLGASAVVFAALAYTSMLGIVSLCLQLAGSLRHC
jgi:hypothetical protein